MNFSQHQKHAMITPEMLERARSRIGKTWKPTADPWFNTLASKDAIRHFCNGIGDMNPFFRDENYAKRTKWGKLIAPPCFLYSVYWPFGLGGLMPGIHAWGSGNTWEWYEPIYEGDVFTYEVTLLSVEEKKSRMAGRTFISKDETLYKNQRGQIVAKALGWSVLAERAAAGGGDKYRDIQRAQYTREEVKNIYEDIEREEIRGANSRYWEDVQVGDALTPVVKGPLSPRDNICFLMGTGSLYMRYANEVFYDYQKRHPAVGMLDSATGIIDVPELVHMEHSRADEVGVTGAYDYAPQRLCWLGHLLNNWMGDDGFLKKMHAELRSFNMVGDTTWLKGKITKKYREGDDHLVDIDCWAEDQRGRTTMYGNSTTLLPSRGQEKSDGGE